MSLLPAAKPIPAPATAAHPRLLLDPEHLRTFVAICETRSFSRAAEAVLRTPSAVSMQIKRLETLLGRSLFVRDSRSVTLTTDGESLLGYARRLLALNEEAVARFVAPEITGTVRFGAPDDFGARFLPGILNRFAQSHPLVETTVTLAGSRQLDSALRAGDLDVILQTTAFEPQAPVEREWVYTESLAWVGLRGGCAWQRRPLPLALSGPTCAWRAAATTALDSATLPWRAAYSSEHAHAQLYAVQADLAIAPLPLSLVTEPFVRLGSAEGLPPLRNYDVHLRKAQPSTCAIDALANAIKAHFHVA